ncbi:transglycosylase SLT domain-containing protein [Actinosynnema sp. NPDC050801]|jgi:hypothetical protein|uniref:transglycosylase SLT domain-containing protein n=1 Tax=unclassified Actinosynnema TaxID=2637065 RepID=UPI0033D07D58
MMRRSLSAILGLAVLAVLVTALGPPAQAATMVRVESQITAHDLPFLDSPYVTGSTLAAGDPASIDCQVAGREAIAGSYTWYRVTGTSYYYPSYAFTGPVNHPACGTAYTVPNAASGWMGPSFHTTPRDALFSTGDTAMVICRVWGDTVEGNNAWFFARGYWIHSSRLAGLPGGAGVPVCRGNSTPKPSWVPSQYWDEILGASVVFAINPKLLAGQLKQESDFRADAVSPAGAKGIAQFLDGTWNGSWNTYRDKCSRDAFEPACAIPAMALFMRLQRAEAISRTADIPGIRAKMAARSDVSDAQINAINWSDRYQIALMGYHAGWDYDYWGPRTADYPVLVYRHAYQ